MIYIVMGVSGCGKTTMAGLLAEVTGGMWLDADDFHSPQNKAKMHEGIPLTDEDRWPWLDRLNAELRKRRNEDGPLFLACSALKQSYRDRLTAGVDEVRFIYLKGSMELIQSRLAGRTNHFMSATLLASQFADLEEPAGAIVLDISQPSTELVREFLRDC